jgi:hypothetical protein
MTHSIWALARGPRPRKRATKLYCDKGEERLALPQSAVSAGSPAARRHPAGYLHVVCTLIRLNPLNQPKVGNTLLKDL